MSDPNKYQLPKTSFGDKTHATIRGLLSAIPYAGGVAAELFSTLVGPPLERRRQKWMNEVADGLRKLEKKQSIKLEDLQSNETFITILMQASQAAMRSHQKEKIEALRNAVLNTALGINISQDFQILFTRYIDELTPSHLLVLNFFANYESELSNAKSYEYLFEEFTTKKAVNITRDEFKPLCQDLIARVLLRVSESIEDFEGLSKPDVVWANSPGEGPKLMVTDMGKELLQFVRET